MCKTKNPIEVILRNSEINIRVSNDVVDRWLVWDTREWIVYERKPYARNTTIIIRTDSIKKAMEKLTEDQKSKKIISDWIDLLGNKRN